MKIMKFVRKLDDKSFYHIKKGEFLISIKENNGLNQSGCFLRDREISYNIGRKMLEDALNSESENEEDDLLEEMEYLEENSGKRRPRRRNYRFCNKLLMSEWMLEKPEDFIDKWIMLPCPVGKRALVIACKVICKNHNQNFF